jgi:uncharacterized protein involved in cysteine biosynthesis
MRLVFGNSRFHRYIWRPMLLSFAMFVGILTLGFIVFLPWIRGLAQHFGLSSAAGTFLALVLSLLLLWFFSVTVYLTLAGLMSSTMWTPLSHEVESALRHDSPMGAPPFFADAIPRTIFSFVICICALIGGFCGALPALFFAAWLSLYDYTSAYYARRGIAFPQQFPLVYQNRGWVSFALGCGLLTLIPFLNVIMLPALVAGATLMCVESDMGRLDRLAERKLT